MRRIVIASIFVILFANLTHADSDCFAAAETQTEMNSCASLDATFAHKAVTGRYDELLRNYQDPEVQVRIRAARDAYFTFWRSHTEMIGSVHGGSAAPMCASLAGVKAAESHQKLLRNNQPDDICGGWGIPLSALSAERLTCGQLLQQSTSDQTQVVANLRDGFGAALGVFESFSSMLLTAITDPNEKQGVRALKSGIRELVHDGEVPPIGTLVSRVLTRCQEKPTQYAANSLVDVLIKIDKR